MLLYNNGGSSKTYVDDVFSTYLYTGNDSTQTITNEIDLSGKGGMVWTKGRGSTYNHGLVDTIRGGSNAISSQSTAAQWSTAAIASFNNNGYTLAPANIDNIWNSNFQTYVSWTFRNADRFFTHTTISHTNGTPTNINLSGLGTVGQVIAKITNTTGDWIVWHRSLTAGNNLRLNTTAAQSTTNAWLSVSGTTATLSASAPTGTYVIYAWAHDTTTDGLIQCGSFTTDVSGNATVNLGWEPQWILFKRTDGAGNWFMRDTMRGWGVDNGASTSQNLFANLTDAEGAGGGIGVTSTGFSTAGLGASITYIYLAIRRPNKPPTTGTGVHSTFLYTGDGVSSRVLTPASFPADLFIYRSRGDNPASYSFSDRLRGNTRLASDVTSAEISTVNEGINFTGGSQNQIKLGANDGASGGFNNTIIGNYVMSSFRRAPGFFSTFAYTGTGANRTTPHDLAAIPDLLIVKSRSAATDWQVWCNGLAANEKLVLNSNAGKVTDATAWNSTLPTSTNISLGTASATNANNATFIAYAFSNLPGIQKIGTYVGDGTSGRVIDCGFTTGARFVCIKAVSTTGSWLVSDTARGITSSADPYLQLNSTEAEITTEDWLDGSSVGFIVNNVTSSNANASGVTYMYWAIS